MTELRIRRYGPDDADRVRELHERALRDAGDFAEDVPEPDLEDVRGSYLDARGEFLVGEQEGSGKVVAMGAYRPVEGHVKEALDSPTEPVAEIKRMRVQPEYQSEGYGRALFEELERRAREDGYRELALDTGVDNEGARGFYEAMGFELAHRIAIEAFGETFHLAVYRKPIQDE